MKLEEDIPLILYINAGRDEDARKRVMNMFLDEELEAERVAAMLPEWVGRTPRGQSRLSYADGLTLRTALRWARKRNAGAVLIFCGEGVLEVGFREKVAALPVPEGWGMLVFGGGTEGPSAVVPVREFSDWMAVAVKNSHFREVARLLKRDRAGRVRWKMGQRCVVPQGMKVYAVRPALVAGGKQEKEAPPGEAAVGTTAPR